MHYSSKIFVCEKNFSKCITSSLWNLMGFYKLRNSFVASHIGRIRGLCDNLSLQSSGETTPRLSNTKGTSTIKKTKPSKGHKRISENIVSHLKHCNNEVEVNFIPRKLITKTHRTPDSFYVVGKKTADTIANFLVKSNVNIPVFEVNPGLGVLTRALLNEEVPEIHAFQSPLWEGLLELEKDSNRLNVYKWDFFSLWKRQFFDFPHGDQEIRTLMSIVKSKPWENGPPVKLFASIPNREFVSHMIGSVVFQRGLSQLGRLEYYLVMTAYDYHCLTSNGSASYTVYRATTVLFQIIFEIKLLCKLPAKDFIPWMTELSAVKKNRLNQVMKADADCMYLLKITPRKDLHHIVEGTENLTALWHFVRQCFVNRTNRVIPTLEKWIPGCGPRLIFNNITIFTEFGELSPLKMLKLFQMFSKWPEYHDSTFLHSMDNYLLKSYVDSDPDGICEADFESIDENMELDPDFDGISNQDEAMDDM